MDKKYNDARDEIQPDVILPAPQVKFFWSEEREEVTLDWPNRATSDFRKQKRQADGMVMARSVAGKRIFQYADTEAKTKAGLVHVKEIIFDVKRDINDVDAAQRIYRLGNLRAKEKWSEYLRELEELTRRGEFNLTAWQHPGRDLFFSGSNNALGCRRKAEDPLDLDYWRDALFGG